MNEDDSYINWSYLLRFPCPGDTCSKSNIIQWRHYRCGGDVYVNLSGDLQCMKCYSSDFIQKCRFHCNAESHGSEFEKFRSLRALQ